MKPVYISRRSQGAATVWAANDWLGRWSKDGRGVTIGVDNFLHPWVVNGRECDARLWRELRLTPGLPAAVCDLIRARHRWNPTYPPETSPSSPEAA